MPKDERSAKPPRRVIAAGDNSSGAAIVSDGEAPLLFESGPFRTWAIWGSDVRPRIGEATESFEPTFIPPPQGVRVTVTDIQPGIRQDIPAGMHETATIDFVFVLSGIVHLVEDGGDEVVLGAGDCAVQAATVHAWHNPGPHLARIAAVLLGADPPS